jgi:hypothetical protein
MQTSSHHNVRDRSALQRLKHCTARPVAETIIDDRRIDTVRRELVKRRLGSRAAREEGSTYLS